MGHTLQEDTKTNAESDNQELLPLLPVKSKDKKNNKKVMAVQKDLTKWNFVFTIYRLDRFKTTKFLFIPPQ